VLRVKPQPLRELEATGLVDESVLHRLLYALTLTRHLDTGELPLGVSTGTRPIAAPAVARRPRSSAMLAAVAPPPEPPSQPLAEPPPQRRELTQTARFASREEIEAKHQKLEHLNHYEVLDLDPTASAEHIASSFATLARRWHPDRLSPDLSDLKDTAMRVFARMSEAHRTLSHSSSREEYDRSAGIGGEVVDSEQAQVVRVLRAAEAFQKAEILLRKRDLLGAEKFAAAAVGGDPEQAEYAALYAWIKARKPGVSEGTLAESLGVLEKAVAQQANNVKIRYYLAGVLKLSGQEAAALRQFRFVAENDPSNLDAARELRLHDMRRHNAPASAQAPGEGLFGRLFKR
jgi:curved DNA-binding protein CbpA